MSKTSMRKLHWRSRMQDTFVPLIDSSGELGVAVGGGADYGEFPFVTAAPGDGINVGDIILEIGGTPVLGMTLGDVRGVLNSCPHPVRIKTVSPATLCKDLRLYLSKCFTPGSVDSTLQQVIRENLFLRAVPNYYGTPRPVHISAESPPITYQEHRSLLRNFRTRSKSLSNLEKAAAQAEHGDEDLGLPLDSDDPVLLPTTSQPEPLHHLPRRPTPTPQIRHLNGLHGDYVEPGVILDANGNATSFASRQSSLRRSSLSNAASPPLTRPPRSLRTLAQVQSLDPTLASQSDSEVVSAIGSHASMIRNHNNNSLSTPQHPLRYGTSIKSSESDLSTCTLPVSRLPLPLSPKRPSSSPGGPRSAHARLFRPQPSHLRPPPTPESPRHHGFNGLHGNHSPMASPHKMARAGGGFGGGELVPVALAQTEADKGLGFSMMGGGPGGGMTVVRRVWDRKQCNTLQPGDAIVKINGADVQSLSLGQVQTVLQEHTKQGEVTLLVYRSSGIYQSISPSSLRRLPPPLLRPPPPPGGSVDTSILTDALPVPRTSFGTPPSTAPTSSSLIQSTSFLESIPVTLTMEPKDWISTGLEDDAGRVTEPDSGLEIREDERVRPLRGFDVELKRKPGEGFGFVIASQDLENTKASLLPHRFVTVRRGSPAAKSGQIRPGDRLEAVEGRSVVTLPHRELAQILRRAGNTLRLTVVPRPSTKRDSRYYSVNLDRGPSGFGFSLRGGSEYNMGLYVLGLMEGGPASRSQKIQVSDQLVEINGDSTAGMTHSQAVEQIRRGGHRIHLVLKRGNGYVPDY
uniref:Membrane-associated guanylate kinase, WW and PDZ domain-containing protein 2-like n=1 Tax=Hippocampus comes TaxID=109280 RepID=A0A3Q2YVL3_HIPCM